MRAFAALVAVLLLVAVGTLGGKAPGLFAVALPYAAIALFVGGVVWRVVRWARSPVPFRIPATCGQQRSLPWIKPSRLENPAGTAGVVGRMALEVLTFRSLFRNTRVDLKDGPRMTHTSNKWLWVFALAFHWSFLAVVLRHMRFFTEPTPWFVTGLQSLDGFFQLGVPEVFISTAAITVALLYLLYRRFANPQVRYVSLASDYFPLFLLLGIATTGILMRHFSKVDVAGVKELAVGLVVFSPKVPAGLGPLFHIHLFLVSALLIYFPFSKLAHMAGVFLSPTRNLANDNRVRRHVNPWNPEVKTHSYAEWEEEFRDKLEAAGLPLGRDKDQAATG